MQKNFRNAIMRAAAFVRGRLEQKPEIGGVAIGLGQQALLEHRLARLQGGREVQPSDQA